MVENHNMPHCVSRPNLPKQGNVCCIRLYLNKSFLLPLSLAVRRRSSSLSSGIFMSSNFLKNFMHKNTRCVAVASVNKPHQLAALQSVDR